MHRSLLWKLAIFGTALTPVSACDNTPAPADTGARTDALAPDAHVAGDATIEVDAWARRASVWSCLGDSLAWPDPVNAQATFGLTFIDMDGASEGPPLNGATVDACPGGDVACSAPDSTATTAGLGRVELTVPTPGVGWHGFMRVTSAGHVPTHVFLSHSIWHDAAWWSGPWAVFETTDLESWAASLSPPLTLDPAMGHALVLTADCCYLERVGAAPRGCSRSDTDELAVTIDGVAPSDSRAGDYFYAFFNLEPGPATIEARLRSTGDVVGRSEIFIVPGGFSEGVIGPTPIRPFGFECVGSVSWPDAPAASLDATFQSFQDADPPDGDGMAIDGLAVAVCAAASDCASPLDTGTTDATGAVTLTLPTPGQGFTGYLRATATGRLPLRMSFFPPIATSESRWLAASHRKTVFTAAQLESLVGGGYTHDPARAVVIATTTDCMGNFSDAVDVSLGGTAAVNAGGDSLWVDVAPGTVELVATLRSTGEEIARMNVQAVAGEITAVHFGPMPD